MGGAASIFECVDTEHVGKKYFERSIFGASAMSEFDMADARAPPNLSRFGFVL